MSYRLKTGYTMRPRYRQPVNRKYFHKNPKIEKNDLLILKRKNMINSQKKEKIIEKVLH